MPVVLETFVIPVLAELIEMPVVAEWVVVPLAPVSPAAVVSKNADAPGFESVRCTCPGSVTP